MKTVIFIPARYASTRYPGKPLVTLNLPDGKVKSLIQMSWEAASSISGVDAVYVATDDDRIAEASRAFGADVVMTSEDCANGTERCADALARAGVEADLVVNFQGDAPLTPAWFVEELIAAMEADPSIPMATPVLRCDPQTCANFVDDRKNGRVGGTTAVFGHDNRALYFSKEVVPYVAPGALPDPVPVFHHVGVYAYRPDALRAYMDATPGKLEVLEGLEQLRFLENGIDVTCVEVEARGRVFWELNNPEDVPRIESALRAMA
ncbi:3-deoxy-manno-octulosonate cytidylyltransferase (CMP-KDO synthetase) [Pseudooceanicola antarcticus]|uniref:3-deoxy-manno-octulosonate cytidylyltransferase n=1 Tax=Pseudooceanicola antarcticus TaxID=1247613 RepID=A0A285IJS7_9RHOB|nr:manno-octulosonate cytidylyltransferase [Pseudooceanicola antarcticus]PJE28991.1 3-deoxy-manno-octulosonate cytidylyltransferase [Pseudooceanicola antarcticus]SNY47336.1 3-deoxy-manno-octulosonate cytidylyltransferase (CMP-KDO synthetase) [Pseudooceanicola antarcticus]